jgi:hypothetical protein
MVGQNPLAIDITLTMGQAKYYESQSHEEESNGIPNGPIRGVEKAAWKTQQCSMGKPREKLLLGRLRNFRCAIRRTITKAMGEQIMTNKIECLPRNLPHTSRPASPIAIQIIMAPTTRQSNVHIELC